MHGQQNIKKKLLVLSTDVAAGWCCVLGGTEVSSNIGG